jgi:Glycosyl hydrolase family 65 central catalytic domain
MSRRMFVPFHGHGIITQFEGYDELEELDWDAYRAKYGNIQRLDRILRAEGDDPNRYQITKQADTVMLFYLFSDDELREIFVRLGYDYRPRCGCAERRVLRPAHLARLDFELCHPRGGTRRARPRKLVGTVPGRARADDAQLLTAAGADIVVTTLDDVDTAAIGAGRLAKRKT